MGLVLLGGCSPAPAEVVGVYQGQSSSGEGSSSGGGASGDGVAPDSTGPIADGSAGSDTGPPTITFGDDGTTTAPVDPGTTTGDPPLESTGPAATTDLPGSSSDGELPTASCMDIFGTASGYVPCTEDDSSCTFSVITGGNSCTTICSSFGEACVHALDNPGGGGNECNVQGDSFCDNTAKGVTICVCTR